MFDAELAGESLAVAEAPVDDQSTELVAVDAPPRRPDRSGFAINAAVCHDTLKATVRVFGHRLVMILLRAVGSFARDWDGTRLLTIPTKRCPIGLGLMPAIAVAPSQARDWTDSLHTREFSIR